LNITFISSLAEITSLGAAALSIILQVLENLVLLRLLRDAAAVASRKHLLVCIPHERTDFYGRFWQRQLLPYAPQAKRALYANLAKALFARFYAKLLIPRLGT
jgi:hypothetical protein